MSCYLRLMTLAGAHRSARPVLLAALLATLCALAPASAAAGTGADIDALLLGDARSPVLDELRDVSDLDATRANEVDELEPRRYDVLVVDADRLSSDDLGDVEAIEDFVAAGGFTMVLDAEPRDHAAIADYTAFDLAAGSGGERSEMVMFGLSDAGGQEEMLIVNSGDLRPEDAAGAPDAEVRALKALAARRAAIAARRQIVADRNDEPTTTAARATPQLPEATTRCSIDNKSLCDLSAQYTSFHIDNTPKFSAALPNGYWNPPNFQRWNSRWPKPLTQEASWQSDEFFDLYLDNDSRPQGDNQVIVYRYYSTVNPARTDVWAHMFDTFKDGPFNVAYNYERAWWTGMVGVNAEPTIGAKSLTISGFEPTTPTTQTSYTTGSSTNLGITAATPDAGGGANVSWSVSQSESTDIPSWSWEARPDPAASSFRWLFSARTPCDARPGGDHSVCFNRTGGIGTDVKLPSETSRRTMQLSAYGRWDACQRSASGSCSAPLPSDRGLEFKLSSPITLADAHCQDTVRSGVICGSALSTHTLAAEPHRYALDPSIVNPCPDAALTDCEPIEDVAFYHCAQWKEEPGKSDACQKRGVRIGSGDSANGHVNERIVGEVTLSKKVTKPGGADVLVTSDIRNAPLRNGSSQAQSELSSGRVHIDAGKTTGEFVILTNDDPPRIRCKDERTATAHIRTFLVEPADAARLRVQRPAGTCDS